ncbi:MAG: hypothetical protein K2W96_03670 [Gemmataceae bacterium]|nr:hypothetical protein [Gemmataceae bacterium]
MDDHKPAPPDDRQMSSPYGPQPEGIDKASGGADSSPFETDSSDERAEKLRKAREQADKK